MTCIPKGVSSFGNTIRSSSSAGVNVVVVAEGLEALGVVEEGLEALGVGEEI